MSNSEMFPLWKILSLVVGMIFSCGKSQEQVLQDVVRPQVLDNTYNEKEGIVIEANADNPNLVSIRQAMLGKPFWMFTEIKNHLLGIPDHQVGRTRIVRFVAKNGVVHLEENPEGYSLSTRYRVEPLLKKFPIVSTTGDRIVFDISSGFPVFDTHDLKTYEEVAYSVYEWSGAVSLSDVVIQSSSQSSTDKISISQRGTRTDELMVPAKYEDLFLFYSYQKAEPIDVKIVIQRYHDQQDIEPKRLDEVGKKMDWEIFPDLGFFVTSARLVPEEDELVVYANKLGELESLTVVASQDVPGKFMAAISDGLQYWASAIGARKINLVKANTDEQFEAADFRVHWISEAAGKVMHHAYAKPQTDPRSGKVMSADIYIPASMVDFERFDLLRRLGHLEKQLEDSSADQPKKRPVNQHAGLSARKIQASRNFLKNQILNIHSRNIFFKQVIGQKLDGNEKTKVQEVFERAFLTSLVAHEFGHVIGLRHNFAASSSANVSEDFKNKLILNLINQGNLESAFAELGSEKEARELRDVKVSSSVMDYLSFKDMIILGMLISEHQIDLLEYDAKATDFLYGRVESSRSNLPFCSDYEEGLFLDCLAFDSGRNPIEFIASRALEIENLVVGMVAYDFLEKFEELKKAGLESEVNLESYLNRVDPKIIAEVLKSPLKHARTLLSVPDGLTMTEIRNLPAVKRIYLLEHIRGPRQDQIMKAANDHSAFWKVWKNTGGDARNRWLQRFDEIISDAVVKGEVSEDQKSRIVSAMTDLFDDVLLYTKDLEIQWAQSEDEKPWMFKGPVSEYIAKIHGTKTQNLLFGESGEIVVHDIQVQLLRDGKVEYKDCKVKVPKFYYSFRQRKESIQLLNPALHVYDDYRWAGKQRAQIKQQIQDYINSIHLQLEQCEPNLEWSLDSLPFELAFHMVFHKGLIDSLDQFIWDEDAAKSGDVPYIDQDDDPISPVAKRLDGYVNSLKARVD